MSESMKDKLYAKYIILKAAGVRISESFQAVIDKIESERAAATVARHQEARA